MLEVEVPSTFRKSEILAQPDIGTALVLPEVRKPYSEWAQPGIGAAGVGVCVCVYLAVCGW